jgi:hypothetical protein
MLQCGNLEGPLAKAESRTHFGAWCSAFKRHIRTLPDSNSTYTLADRFFDSVQGVSCMTCVGWHGVVVLHSLQLSAARLCLAWI